MRSSRISLGDLLLPLLVVAVVGMMIFPLPAAMLDILLMLNIALSLLLLVSSVYLAEPERFTVLPTVLLITTLFRLSLNISTTRQLLAKGEAPEVVAAFGQFVVGGDILVGLVIFLILTVVQFLVIAKGAERVAEVAARFTLDAMPGKQMAIDADVRAGLLTLADARERRRDLHRESKLYGSLDGAMKFIKGDAIAGLLITAINIVAGLYLGVSTHGLSLSDALHRYTVFTIGDGLVSQIPALLVAVAAGITVTRVADKDGAFVGGEILAQLGREPQAVVVTAVLLLVLAAVPGLPTIPFFLLSLVLFTVASRKRKRDAEAEQNAQTSGFTPQVLSPLCLTLSIPAARTLQQERALSQFIRDLKNEIFCKFGVVIPDLQYELDQSQPDVSAILLLKGVNIGAVRVAEAAADGERLTERVSMMIGSGVRSRLVDFIDDGHTRTLFDVHHHVAEDLINSVVPSIVSVTGLTTILRELIRERVSIRELRTILQAIAEHNLEGGRLDRLHASPAIIDQEHSGAKQKELSEMLAAVRRALTGVITAAVTTEDRTVRAVVLDAELDHLLTKIARTRVPLQRELAERITGLCRRKLNEVGKGAVLITGGASRLLLSQLLGDHGERTRVLADDEISADVQLDVLGIIRLESVTSADESALGAPHSDLAEAA